MESHTPESTLFGKVSSKAREIEQELKRLNRWQVEPLPPEKLENMGAFGSNTMAFEQWLQFILIPRLQQIVKDHDEFPSNSMLGTYAIRVFDGDYEAARLQELLYDIDELINTLEINTEHRQDEEEKSVKAETVSIGDSTIPPVIYTLAELLPQFEGDDLESQLQTFDTFLSILAPSARPTFTELLRNAASLTANPLSKLRIEHAARSVAQGGQAAEPYNHEESMRKYREEHKRNFPS